MWQCTKIVWQVSVTVWQVSVPVWQISKRVWQCDKILRVWQCDKIVIRSTDMYIVPCICTLVYALADFLGGAGGCAPPNIILAPPSPRPITPTCSRVTLWTVSTIYCTYLKCLMCIPFVTGQMNLANLPTLYSDDWWATTETLLMTYDNTLSITFHKTILMGNNSALRFIGDITMKTWTPILSCHCQPKLML